MKLERTLFIAIFAALAGCAGVGAESESLLPARDAESAAAAVAADPVAAAAATITPDDIHERIAFLASDELRGRDTPSPGLEKAAEYIAAEFQRLGLRAAGEDGYIQRYPLQRRALDGERVRFALRNGRATAALRPGEDFFVIPGAPYSGSGEVVFAGSAENAEANPALRGRIAVFDLAGVADQALNAAIGQAVGAASQAGANAAIFVLDASFPADLVQRNMERATRAGRLEVGEAQGEPIFFVTNAAAERLFREIGQDLAALRARRADGAAPITGVTAELEAPVRLLEDHRPPNVVAVLPGSDPELRDTYVVFSAHFDHVGVGRPDASGDSIYNGADDNASGTSALLEVAEAFASLPEAPARSLVFLAVSGEEKGLLGSRYYSDNPTVPLESIVANINVDMIGRNAPDSIVVIGQEYSSLGPLVNEVAAERPELGLTVAPDIWPQERFFFRSDHFNFARKEIPALFFFAGVHEDYHRPSDHVEKIDTDKAARVARLIFYTGYEIATRADAPRWTEEGLQEVRALTGGGR